MKAFRNSLTTWSRPDERLQHCEQPTRNSDDQSPLNEEITGDATGRDGTLSPIPEISENTLISTKGDHLLGPLPMTIPRILTGASIAPPVCPARSMTPTNWTTGQIPPSSNGAT